MKGQDVVMKNTGYAKKRVMRNVFESISNEIVGIAQQIAPQFVDAAGFEVNAFLENVTRSVTCNCYTEFTTKRYSGDAMRSRTREENLL